MEIQEDQQARRRRSNFWIGLIVGSLLGGTIVAYILARSGWEEVIIRSIDLLGKVMEQGGTSALFSLLALIIVASFSQYRIRHDRKHYSAEIKRVTGERNELQQIILAEYQRLSTQQRNKE